MAPHVIIDRFNLTISLLITIAWQISGFVIAWTLQFDKITDFTGGSNFFILALITLLTGDSTCRLPLRESDSADDDLAYDVRYVALLLPYSSGMTHFRRVFRNIVASVLMMLWAARLAGFLLFRVLKTGSDTRFDDIRSHFLKFAGFWAGQILWVWVVALPVVILNSPAVSDRARGGDNPSFGTGLDVAGIIVFAIGLLWEALGDIQKYQFKSGKPPKGQPCTKGLWYFSRHPPYFGEITLHWGLWVLCLSPSQVGHVSTGARRAQLAAMVSPLFTIILLFFLSGLPPAEKPTAKRYFMMSHPAPADSEPGSFTRGEAKNETWNNYKTYLARTSIVLPIPPQLYRPLPEWMKRTVLLDFVFFRFDEEKDGSAAIEEARRQDA